jgi:hypothetical protein
VTTAVTVALGVLTTWFFARERKPVLYLFRRVTSLAQRRVHGLAVTFDHVAVVAPALVELELSNVGRSDLGSAAFENNMPIAITLPDGVEVRAVLRTVPDDLPIKILSASLTVGPHMLKAGRVWTIELLVDGGDLADHGETWVNYVWGGVKLEAGHLVNTRTTRLSSGRRGTAFGLVALVGGMILALAGAAVGLLKNGDSGEALVLIGMNLSMLGGAEMVMVMLFFKLRAYLSSGGARRRKGSRRLEDR